MNKLLRSVLAIGAVIAVAGPGLVLADNPDPTYVPKIIQVLGPSSVAKNGSADYNARVYFTNNVVVDFDGTPVVFSAARGSIDASGLYSAPSTSGRDSIKASYTNAGVTVNGSRIISNP